MRFGWCLAALSLLAAGCGDDSSLPGSQNDLQPAADLSVTLDFTAVPPDLSVRRDSSVLPDLAPPADFSGVQCGNMTCAQGKVCCASLVNQMLVQSCETSCNVDMGTVPITCDGPEDCGGGGFCCIDVKVAGGNMVMTSGTACTNACKPSFDFIGLTGKTRLCHSDNDCDPNAGLFGAKCCSVQGQQVHFCALNVPMLGITCP